MAVSTRKRADAETRRPSGPGAGHFLREVYEELRKVVWPTPAELYRYTLVVVLTVAIISSFVGGVDFGLGQIVKKFVYAGVAGQ